LKNEPEPASNFDEFADESNKKTAEEMAIKEEKKAAPKKALVKVAPNQ